MWSVICTVSDNKVIYSLVQGEAPEAEFTGSRRQCLAYIRRMSAEWKDGEQGSGEQGCSATYKAFTAEP
jgi:hypothetical protein